MAWQKCDELTADRCRAWVLYSIMVEQFDDLISVSVGQPDCCGHVPPCAGPISTVL